MDSLSDEKTFLKKYHLNEAEYNRTGLQWEQLSGIFEAYLKEMPQYRALENYFSDCLKTVDNVHSVITRRKDPERLIEALIRKKIANQELEINSKNYNEIATDLIEIRVLHLFKEDWEYAHEYITNKWVLKEKPIAYVCEGDDRDSVGRELLASFQNRGCDLRYHELGYRSVTYLAISSIDNKTNYIEILSRTVFEEGWNTIDHAIRDSRDIDSPVLMRYLSHFSHRMADMADEMGSFLHLYLNEKQEKDGKPSRELEIAGKLNNDPKQYIQAPKPANNSKERETALSALENARIESMIAAGADESTATPQQEFRSSLSSLLKKRETPPETRQGEHPQKSEEQTDVQPANSNQQQPVVPVAPAQAAALPAPQEEYPKIQPGILDAQRNNDPQEQENSQKFTLSKLKQAIQGITPKNAYQGQQTKPRPNNGWDAKE
jgi:putative GTP pyrophosphokinase